MIWNAEEWQTQFELLRTQKKKLKQKEETRFLFRSMRIEVF